MKRYTLAAALALTAWGATYSQTPTERGWGLVKPGMVVMPLSDLQLIHAKRIVANDLLRERAQMVAIQRNLVDGLRMQVGIREQEAAKARQDAGIAWEAAATCKDENVTLQRKNKRLRGWAWAAKIQLGAIVAFGGFKIYKSIAP